jgi:hypothetical protein
MSSHLNLEVRLGGITVPRGQECDLSARFCVLSYDVVDTMSHHLVDRTSFGFRYGAAMFEKPLADPCFDNGTEDA